jgi:hypothetical protein
LEIVGGGELEGDRNDGAAAWERGCERLESSFSGALGRAIGVGKL